MASCTSYRALSLSAIAMKSAFSSSLAAFHFSAILLERKETPVTNGVLSKVTRQRGRSGPGRPREKCKGVGGGWLHQKSGVGQGCVMVMVRVMVG